ncbi:hypothetical protein BT96DRAFT_1094639 [Gymnopus androsaceus JB14]|uniref:Uncharacterized protein n=1 Tax=Gymnopus androsaceus JB14 TaxID=1447944 RepID=A0A6A4HVS5_9AGAR|nr:hypothetical protein BT96DRAFT_1094639 [Gymnopus androsaceus JB14]
MNNTIIQIGQIRVRVSAPNRQRKEPTQPEWPMWDREIFRRCISLSLYKPQTPFVWTRSPCYEGSPRPTNPGT